MFAGFSSSRRLRPLHSSPLVSRSLPSFQASSLARPLNVSVSVVKISVVSSSLVFSQPFHQDVSAGLLGGFVLCLRVHRSPGRTAALLNFPQSLERRKREQKNVM